MGNKIGIIGSGTVGQLLANGFLKNGYEVKIGTRNTDKLKDWLEKAGSGASVGSFNEAAKFGDIIVLATLGTAAIDALKLANESNLENKVIIDATNPISTDPPEEGVIRFFTKMNESLMERLQSQYPKARFVKAFNSVGAHLMVEPDFDGIMPTMFIAGNDDDAKKEVKIICELFGWEVEDMGGAAAARAIEPLCILWCIPGFKSNQWNQAFKFLKK